ncbi:MAG: hypothetical protein VW709_20615 [Rickettsiales bacterium]
MLQSFSDAIGGLGGKGLMLFGDSSASGLANRAGQRGRQRPIRIVFHRLSGPFQD